MTHHREQCRSVPPKTPTVNGVYHRHYCIHDATLPFGTVLEHVCRCGLTWTDEQLDAQPLPFVVEPVHRPDPWGIWPLVLIIAVVAAIVGLTVEVWR